MSEIYFVDKTRYEDLTDWLLKQTYHYIYNAFIVCHNKQRMYFKNIYKTLTCMLLEQLKRNGTKVKKLQALTHSVVRDC